MARDVGQRLLGGAQQRDLDLGVDRARRAGGRELGGDAAFVAVQVAVTFSIASGRRACSSSIGVIARTERRASARLSRASWVAAWRWPVSSVPLLARLGGGLELGDDPRETLRERVVDLARGALALLHHAGLALALLHPQRHDEHQAGDQDVDERERREQARGARSPATASRRPGRRALRSAGDDHRRRHPPAGQMVDGQVADEHEEAVQRAARDERGGRTRAGRRRRPRRSAAGGRPQNASIHDARGTAASASVGPGAVRVSISVPGERREREQHVRQRRESALQRGAARCRPGVLTPSGRP